jgi:TMEM175 potassium channel family protein
VTPSIGSPRQRAKAGACDRGAGSRGHEADAERIAVSKTRFESFSDGVFAFAITLLVLGFAVPMHGELKWTTDADLLRELLKLWPNLIAYALSFGVIGIMWQNHHAVFRTVARVDRFTVFLNLTLLSSTVLIPFVTATLGFYPMTHTATFLYGLVLSACATSYNVIVWHLVRSRAFDESVKPERIKGTVIAYRIGWLTYVGATLVALVFPIASFALYVLIAAYYLVPRGIDDDLDAGPRSAPERGQDPIASSTLPN